MPVVSRRLLGATCAALAIGLLYRYPPLLLRSSRVARISALKDARMSVKAEVLSALRWSAAGRLAPN
jgi:hypothetical protein